MAHIHKFRLPHESGRAIQLGGVTPTGNKITILLGENGTKKSLLLRQIVIEALSKIGDKKLKEASGSVEFARMPSKIVAVSATATDRFPSRPRRGEVGRSSRFDYVGYNYVGPRSARNIISRSHSLSELILALLGRPDVVRKRGAFFKKMADKLGLPLEIHFQLAVTASWPASSKATKLKSFEEYLLTVSNSDTKKSSNISHGVARLELTPASDLVRELDAHLLRTDELSPNIGGSFARRRTIDLTLNVAESKFDTDGIRPQVLAAAFDTGYLVSTNALLGGAHESNFSAGQWALFSTMFTLAAVADDDSLILVDEPENGLHPNWQRSYLEWLEEALESCRGCQVVIATHSPLVVGSLYGDSSEVVILKRRGKVVRAEVVATPSGWDANSILEDVFGVNSSRGEAVTRVVERALGLLSSGVEENREKLRAGDKELLEIRERLPLDDELSFAIDAIRKSYNGE